MGDELIVFVKAGDDGKSYGACPFCQRLFMLLLLKSSHVPDLHFKVATVYLAKPPELFRRNTLRRVPAIIHGDVALDVFDEILAHLENVFPTPELAIEDPEADTCCIDVFQKFCFYIKEVSKEPSGLIAELARIDDLFAKRHYTFISANKMTHLDCELLPKVHQIRVAAKALKGFEIPSILKHLWTYLKRAYEHEAFQQACPSDQEVIVHWSDRPDTRSLSMEEKARLAREPPRFSFDTPFKSTSKS